MTTEPSNAQPSNGRPTAEQLRQHCLNVVAAYPHQVTAFKEGRCGMAFFVTQVMNATLGCADPQDIWKELLNLHLAD